MGGHAATWHSSPWVYVWYLRSGCVCSQQFKPPTLPIPGRWTTLSREPPLLSPKMARSTCVGFVLRLTFFISPSWPMRACDMWRDWWSFSEKPSWTAMLCFFAVAQMRRISGESTTRQFSMYFLIDSVSTARFLKALRMGDSSIVGKQSTRSRKGNRG